MASLKEIKSRIASVRSTQKITSAMRMVSSAKLHHAQGMMEAFLRYKDGLDQIVQTLSPQTDQALPSPSMQGESSILANEETDGLDNRLNPQSSIFNHQSSTLLIPVSSNSGLCGAFNSNVAKATIQHMRELESQGQTVRLLPIGKKIAHELQRQGYDCNLGYYNLLDKVEKKGSYAEVTFLIEFAMQLHQSGEIDSAEFIYHHFRSTGSQVITIDRLPIDIDQAQTQASKRDGWLTEPSPQELLIALSPRLLNAHAYGILLDSLTSEHAARMMAMQTADDNANDLLKELTLLYNKTRQQAITNELIDIMGGKVSN